MCSIHACALLGKELGQNENVSPIAAPARLKDFSGLTPGRLTTTVLADDSCTRDKLSVAVGGKLRATATAQRPNRRPPLSSKEKRDHDSDLL